MYNWTVIFLGTSPFLVISKVKISFTWEFIQRLETVNNTVKDSLECQTNTLNPWRLCPNKFSWSQLWATFLFPIRYNHLQYHLFSISIVLWQYTLKHLSGILATTEWIDRMPRFKLWPNYITHARYLTNIIPGKLDICCLSWTWVWQQAGLSLSQLLWVLVLSFCFSFTRG